MGSVVCRGSRWAWVRVWGVALHESMCVRTPVSDRSDVYTPGDGDSGPPKPQRVPRGPGEQRRRHACSLRHGTRTVPGSLLDTH